MTAMRVFTVEEFHTVIDELARENGRFEMLCRIAERALRPSIYVWCGSDMALSGRGYEEEIMQEVHIKLITTCMTHFFRRDDLGGELNDDPDGFNSWMFKVALNVKRDYAKKVRQQNFRVRGFEEGEEGRFADEHDDFLDDDTIERLSQAFDIVMNSDAKVYKVLTWLAFGLFVISRGIPKHKTSAEIVSEFEIKTLGEMWNSICMMSAALPWLEADAQQKEKIERALGVPYDDTRPYSRVRYKEFFMKKDGKATISDWVNRMNSTIKRVMIYESLNN